VFWCPSGPGGNRLHYLADRANLSGQFCDADLRHLDQAFPVLMKQLELMLTSGELNPRHQASRCMQKV
jgi:cytoskeleton bundling-enhancing protein CbeA-like protein